VPVEWNESLRIGVAVVDAQHRELFSRVAAFESALERGDRRRIDETFAFLREYALVHFACEEELMRDAAYPSLEDHRAAHLQFGERLAALVRDREAGAASAFLELRARNWIVVWLLDHVAGTDQALGRYLRGRNARARE
jgi:hemerythrin